MNPFTAPIRVVPRRSSRLIASVYALHALAAVGLFGGWPLTGGLVALLLGVAASAVLSHLEFNAAAAVYCAVLLDSEGRWIATAHDGEQHLARLHGTPLLTAFLILIPLRVNGRFFLLALSRDTTPTDTLRRLRVRLRFGSSTPATASVVQ